MPYNWNVDVLISGGMWQGERSVKKFLNDNQVNCFYLPVHEYEMTHGAGGKRSAPGLKGENRKAFDRKMLMNLLWGEDFILTKQMLNQK